MDYCTESKKTEWLCGYRMGSKGISIEPPDCLAEAAVAAAAPNQGRGSHCVSLAPEKINI